MEKDEKAILLGKRITELRESKRLSIRKLSKIIGISDTALAKIETGPTKSITVSLGLSIAKALDISFNELFEIELPQNEGNEEKLKMEIDQLNVIITTQKSIIEAQKEMIELNEERFRRYKKLYTELEIVFNFVENEFPKIAPGSDFNTTMDEMRKRAFIQIQNEKSELSE